MGQQLVKVMLLPGRCIVVLALLLMDAEFMSCVFCLALWYLERNAELIEIQD